MSNTFQQQLEREIGTKLKLRINDNRSTMLSVKWEPGLARVSLHKFFLEAPKNVMDDLACYIRQKGKKMAPTMKQFIDENVQKLDYSQKINSSKLQVHGDTYNIQEIMQEVNHRYFDNQLNLNITWFGSPRNKNRSRITFGLYQDPLKLIKINRLLDSPRFPKYVLSFVIYHEMLHHICPAYTDDNGRGYIHTREFKHLEKKFDEYEVAQQWIKRNIDNLFKG